MNLPETAQVLDSTKIDCYIRCPRQFFYQYVLGWNLEEESVHLVFGKAWHKSMRVILRNNYRPECIIPATTAFLKEYTASITAEQDAVNAPKDSHNGIQSLSKYIYEYCDRDNFEVLYTEIGGTVAIGRDRQIHFKMDSVLRDLNANRQIVSLEHKTGSQNSLSWRESFKMSVQTGTYNHILYCMYPEPEIYGVLINGAIFTKGKGVEFVRVPARRRMEMMDVWLATVNHYYDEIMRDYALLDEVDEDSPLMLSFTQRPTSCIQFNRPCIFLDFCMSWPNPIHHADDVPERFAVRHWDPRLEEVEERMEVRL